MIVRPLEPAVFYRMQTAREPGRDLEAKHNLDYGDRFSRPGIPALYLASDLDTARAEFRQQARVIPPGQLLAYRVSLARAVRFESGYSAETWDEGWKDWDCDFRSIAARGHDPPSWLLGDQVRERGIPAILFPSTEGTGINLVLFTDLLDPRDRVERLHDLPRQDASG